MSGPLLDRIDLHVSCPAIPAEKLTSYNPGEKSGEIRKRVQSARDKQTARYEGTNIMSNAELSARDIKTYCPLDAESLAMIRQAAMVFSISGRGFHRILKVARTIADLDQSEKIFPNHIAEALQYRLK